MREALRIFQRQHVGDQPKKMGQKVSRRRAIPLVEEAEGAELTKCLDPLEARV
jgi:hypothetical protein